MDKGLEWAFTVKYSVFLLLITRKTIRKTSRSFLPIYMLIKNIITKTKTPKFSIVLINLLIKILFYSFRTLFRNFLMFVTFFFFFFAVTLSPTSIKILSEGNSVYLEPNIILPILASLLTLVSIGVAITICFRRSK